MLNFLGVGKSKTKRSKTVEEKKKKEEEPAKDKKPKPAKPIVRTTLDRSITVISQIEQGTRFGKWRTAEKLGEGSYGAVR